MPLIPMRRYKVERSQVPPSSRVTAGNERRAISARFRTDDPKLLSRRKYEESDSWTTAILPTNVSSLNALPFKLL